MHKFIYIEFCLILGLKVKLIFKIVVSSGKSGHEMNTQHLAMGLIGKLLQRTATSCKVR